MNGAARIYCCALRCDCGAAAADRRPCSNRSISPAAGPAAANLQQRRPNRTDRQTDGRTHDSCIDPAPHILRTVPTIYRQTGTSPGGSPEVFDSSGRCKQDRAAAGDDAGFFRSGFFRTSSSSLGARPLSAHDPEQLPEQLHALSDSQTPPPLLPLARPRGPRSPDELTTSGPASSSRSSAATAHCATGSCIGSKQHRTVNSNRSRPYSGLHPASPIPQLTCHCGITQCYLPPGRGSISTFPQQSWYSI